MSFEYKDEYDVPKQQDTFIDLGKGEIIDRPKIRNPQSEIPNSF